MTVVCLKRYEPTVILSIDIFPCDLSTEVLGPRLLKCFGGTHYFAGLPAPAAAGLHNNQLLRNGAVSDCAIKISPG